MIIIWLLSLLLLVGVSLLFWLSVERNKPLGVPGLERRILKHDGRRRSYLLYTPPGIPADQRTALVLVFHGGGGTAQGIFKKSGMHLVARRHGFRVLYPEGTGRGRRRLNWNAGSNPPQGYAEEHEVDDVGFVEKLLQYLDADAAYDKTRVYATGISKGGMLAYRLACELPHRFAAIAPVAATLTFNPCRPAQALAILHIHGEKDENVPLKGGRGKYTSERNSFPPVWEGLKQWLRINRCSDLPERTQPAPDTSCLSYRHCRSGKEVAFCIVKNGGHSWPGARRGRRQAERGEYVSRTFDASEYVYLFFRRFAIDSQAESNGPSARP